MIATAADMTVCFPDGVVPKVAAVHVEMAQGALALLYFDYKGVRMKDWRFQPPPDWQPGAAPASGRKSGAEPRSVRRNRDQREAGDLLAEDLVVNMRKHTAG